MYGTLTDPARTATVLDAFTFEGSAVLDGMHRVEGEYPTLAPGGSVEGRILETDAVAALDAYEGVDRGLYVRVPVPVAPNAPFGGDDGHVQTYVGAPERLHVEEAVTWPGTGTFAERVRRVTEGCVVRPLG